MVGRGETQIDLNELNALFLPPPAEPAEGTYFRGILLAVAQDMRVRLADKPGRELAIERLAEAADLAGECVPT